MFVWLVHTGYIHGGFELKCPIVTIIESVWGLLRVIQVYYGDFFSSVLGLEKNGANKCMKAPDNVRKKGKKECW